MASSACATFCGITSPSSRLPLPSAASASSHSEIRPRWSRGRADLASAANGNDKRSPPGSTPTAAPPPDTAGPRLPVSKGGRWKMERGRWRMEDGSVEPVVHKKRGGFFQRGLTPVGPMDHCEWCHACGETEWGTPGCVCMDRGGFRDRAISALVQYAKAAFEEDTNDTRLVAPISPCPQDLIQIVLDNVGLRPHDVILDLGCGDGRWVLAAAIRGCLGRGVDLNEDLLQRGRQAAAEAGVSCSVALDNTDMFHTSLAGSTVIIVYLLRESLAKMKGKLEAEADQGTRVISVGFQIRGWIPAATVVVRGLHAYVYCVPDRDRGASAAVGIGSMVP